MGVDILVFICKKTSIFETCQKLQALKNQILGSFIIKASKPAYKIEHHQSKSQNYHLKCLTKKKMFVLLEISIFDLKFLMPINFPRIPASNAYIFILSQYGKYQVHKNHVKKKY